MADAIPTRERFNSYWDSGPLTPIEQACLASFVEMGHPITLYSYDLIKNLPKGIALADAATVLPRESMAMQKSKRSVVVFSDRFRYELLARDLGGWVDCDVLCVKPLPLPTDYIFGWENDHLINNAILKIPPGSALLDQLRALFSIPARIPPWLSRGRRFRYKLKSLVIPIFGLEHMSWGASGPQALTYYSVRLGVHVHAAPRRVFYPVRSGQTRDFLDADCNIARHVSDETVCIHLWNSILSRHTKGQPAAKGSFLSRVLNGTWRESLHA